MTASRRYHSRSQIPYGVFRPVRQMAKAGWGKAVVSEAAAVRIGAKMADPMPSETVLPDDYPVYGDYFYLADGRVYRSDWHGVTVGELKRREGFKEVRRCDWRRFNGTAAQINDLSR